MNLTQFILSFIGMVLGSGLIQFFITRKDNNNKKLIELKKELRDGLDERETTGKERYLEHKEAIQKLNEAIFQLTENDTHQAQYMKYIGDEIMGLAHDKLVYLTDKYQERGAITLKEKATLHAIYNPYHIGLGGNGDGQAGYEYCMKLPIVTDSQAREMDNNIGRTKGE